ncbi:MAG: aspartyl protease family protein [Planctomycetes bacterium]|nr:aspartyl protease family protein [Planctomycetota bacterium]MBI3834671.1 aspartyl protease family protein [Planctomycetota bacterium]
MPKRSQAFNFGVGVLACLCSLAEQANARPTQMLRMGKAGSLVTVQNNPLSQSQAKAATATTATTFPHPSPRLAGFQPFVVVTTSSKTASGQDNFDQQIEPAYDCVQNQGPEAFPCGALNPPARSNFIIGILDSGSVSNLFAEPFADTIGLSDQFLTTNTITLSGVGGQSVGYVTQPVGFYVAGLSAISPLAQLDMGRLVGQSNFAAVWTPPIVCADVFAVSGLVGTPLIAYFNVTINVDNPQRFTLDEFTYKGPDVHVQDPQIPLPAYAHSFSLDFNDFGAVSTALYLPGDILGGAEGPASPTTFITSILAGGSVFMASVQLREGPAGVDNQPISVKLMLDTGSQASIISRGTAANLSLPIQPDFMTEVCGVGGDVISVPGYYIDYVKINAFGGALEFSHAPFVVEDLPAPDGSVLDGVLGMNFFWNRNAALEPSLSGSSFFEVSDPIPFAFGDYDADRYVDLDDMFFWSACQTAPDGKVAPDCIQLDGDGDGDVDLKDFAGLQRCFSGLDSQADPACGF